MPRDGTMPAPQPQPEPQPPPTREQVLANLRQQNFAHFVEQIISVEADKIMLANELLTVRRRVAELERQLAGAPATVEPQ